jgi:hypothetical protein
MNDRERMIQRVGRQGLGINAPVWEGGSLSLTYSPGPSTSKMHIKIGYNSPKKRSDGPLKDPTVVNIARKVNMESGRGMLTL